MLDEKSSYRLGNVNKLKLSLKSNSERSPFFKFKWGIKQEPAPESLNASTYCSKRWFAAKKS